MGRAGITYDQVAAAADALIAEIGSATLKAVRERLGSGGMGTIHKHLATWQANRPKQVAPVVELPVAIARELNTWVIQAATAARAESEESALQAQAAAAELARAGEVLEADLDDSLEQVVALTTERDKAQATATAHAAEIERLSKEVDRERDLAGKAQVDAAEARLKVDAQTGQLADMKATIEKLNATLETERQARIAAELSAGVLKAERDAARKEAEDEGTRIKSLQEHLDAALVKTEQTRTDYEKRLAYTVEASGKATASERAAADIERAAAQSALMENAGLKAKLESSENIQVRLQSEVEKLIARLGNSGNSE